KDSPALVEENALEIHLQRLRIRGLGHRFLLRNFSVLHQLEERLVEVQHPILGAGFDRCAQLVQPVFLEQFPDRGRVDHDLHRGRHAAGQGGHHALTNHGPQGGRQLPSNLLAFVGLEEIKDASDGLGGIGRMQCGEHQVPRVRRTHGGSETQRIPHFSEHDDVRVLAENISQRVFEGKSVQPHLSLFDDALVVLEHVLDGILHRDNVLFAVGVDVLDHRRQRGGFPAAGGSGYEDNPARGLGNPFQGVGQSQFLEAGDICFYEAHGQAELPALLVEIGAKPSDACFEIRKIYLPFLVQPFLQMRRNNIFYDEANPLDGGKRTLDCDQLAVDAEYNRSPWLDVNVRSPAVNRELQNAAK